MKLVGAIIDDVRARGDEALIDYTARFDKVELSHRNCGSVRISCGALRRVLTNAWLLRCEKRFVT